MGVGKIVHRVFSSAILALVCFVGTGAFAAPIDNPGNFFWDTGTGDISFADESTITRSIPSSSGSLDIDLDSAGNITFNSFTIGSVFVSPYTVEVLVTSGSSSGTLDASVGGYNLKAQLTLRIKITGNGVGTQCVTPSFSRSFEGFYVVSGTSGELRIYSGTGGSLGGSTGWLNVPAITASCNGQATTINNTFKFNGSFNNGLLIERLGAFTDPGPTGS